MTDRLEQPQASAIERLDRDPSSRKRFLKGLGGTGAVAAFGAFLAACGDDDEGSGDQKQKSSSQSTRGDLDIVNYALTLEYLEADFYRQAAASGQLNGGILDVAKTFGAHEEEHVKALEATVRQLGGKPPSKPKGKFALDSQEAILGQAAEVENLGAAAYLGQAGRIKSKEVLAAALSIHTVEGRHAAALNAALGRTITPDGAFAKPATMDEVLKKVKPLIQS